MFANYHTHTTRCRHAAGADREYVEAAIKSGLTILGFADHTPLPDRAMCGMAPEELPGYVASLAALRQEFQKELTLHIGLELEFNPKAFPRQLDFLKENGVEYLILGQHILFGIPGDPGMHIPTDNEHLLDYHCGLIKEALDTGKISYVAHPDSFNFTGSKEVYDKHLRQLCRHANDLHIPLEINLLGLRTDRYYPREHFWQIAGEEGCQVVLGCDAHEPISFFDTKGPEKAKYLIDTYQLNVIDTVSLRSL